MTLNEKYRIHNKSRSNKVLLVLFIMIILSLFSSSFSRYLTTSQVNANVGIAKWCIKVNDREINQDTTSIQNEISLITTDNMQEGDIILPGQEGYFDIEIDPQYTEVSLKYTITLDTSNLPDNIVFDKYSINDFSVKENLPLDYKLENTILLAGREKLSDTDAKTYRIYWNWPIENGFISDLANEYKIKVNVQVEQIIGEI